MEWNSVFSWPLQVGPCHGELTVHRLHYGEVYALPSSRCYTGCEYLERKTWLLEAFSKQPLFCWPEQLWVSQWCCSVPETSYVRRSGIQFFLHNALVADQQHYCRHVWAFQNVLAQSTAGPRVLVPLGGKDHWHQAKRTAGSPKATHWLSMCSSHCAVEQRYQFLEFVLQVSADVLNASMRYPFLDVSLMAMVCHRKFNCRTVLALHSLLSEVSSSCIVYLG